MTQSDERIPVSRLNEMSQGEFVEAVGQVFEYAPWVASNTWMDRPFEDIDGLHGAMIQTLKDADREKQIKFLRGHSDMQVTPEAIEAMTPDSRQEHISAGFDKLTVEQQQRMERLVRAYKTRFGFPFIAALRGRNAADMFALAEQHLGNDSTDMELYFAFAEVGKITRMRIDKLVV
ncbi:MAG: 2-oxo-4-hydroxy-4-carboxy-5-ureidoimidazoline decarboxylase [Dehalococcoidia bacterium]|jgi:2-oxo-4-hydroxy-4-carboxy-5-ureidoimidazoline decarboxylase|nr:2-oxo-4-hydroxy-4-carboxy-5-ureidoimidazoline decarboxylase [Dehalococcoidia bacterium]